MHRVATPTIVSPTSVVRVLVVDDHPAMRAGLHGLLVGEPGIECVGALAGTDGLAETVGRTRPDVVVLDYALGADDGLTTCFRLKQLRDAPAVVLYSAYVGQAFAVPAALAQADATISKSAPVDQLLATVREAASGAAQRPLVDHELMQAASARLLADDLPIAGMLLGGTPITEIAATLDLPMCEIRSRALRIIGRLQAGRRASANALDFEAAP
jgi:DNA-binding NarL/FixJ family response regulator